MSPHADALRLSTDRARGRCVLVTPGGDPVVHSVTDLRTGRESNPLHDHLIRELVRSVAQATIEYVAEQDYDGPAEMFAERKQLADEVVRFTMACAAEEDDVAVNAVRRAMR